MTEQRRIQHIADHDGKGLCGAPMNPDMAGLLADCPECWQRYREKRAKPGK